MTTPKLSRVESTPSYFRPSHPRPVVTNVTLGPLLLLTSHSHAPPLNPTPRLKYDLRSTPNPPKSIRDSHTGMSKRLREHMLDHDAFVELLDKAERDIKAKMPAAEKEFKEGRLGPFTPMSPVVARRRTWSTQKLEEDEDEEQEEQDEDEDDYGSGEATASDDEGEDDEPEKGRPVVRVGAFCERGQHRSVAFVEELATRDWPKQWDVRIIHRDLGKRRGSNNSKVKSKKPPVRGASIVLDDD